MYQKVMVPLDGSELAECLLPHVEAIAKGCSVQNVLFVSVVDPHPFSRTYGEHPSETTEKDVVQGHVEAIKEYLDKIVSQADYGGVNVQSEVLLERDAAESLADYATKNGVDLIIIATHGRSGVSRWAWGSIADRILHSACVPVLMVRAPGCIPGF